MSVPGQQRPNPSPLCLLSPPQGVSSLLSFLWQRGLHAVGGSEQGAGAGQVRLINIQDVWHPSSLRELLGASTPAWARMPNLQWGKVEGGSSLSGWTCLPQSWAPRSGWIGSSVSTQKRSSELQVNEKGGVSGNVLFKPQMIELGAPPHWFWGSARCRHLWGGGGSAVRRGPPGPVRPRSPAERGAPGPRRVPARPGPAPSSLPLARWPHPLARCAQWEAGAGPAEPSAGSDLLRARGSHGLLGCSPREREGGKGGKVLGARGEVRTPRSSPRPAQDLTRAQRPRGASRGAAAAARRRPEGVGGGGGGQGERAERGPGRPAGQGRALPPVGERASRPSREPPPQRERVGGCSHDSIKLCRPR